MASASDKSKNTYVILAVGLVLGFAIGFLYAKVSLLEGGTTTVKGTTTEQAGNQPTTVAAKPNVKVAKPDASKDHWLGKKDAKAT